VTIPATSGGRGSRRGLRIHRSSLPRSAATVRNRIPVTAPARTIADITRNASATTVRRAIREAEFRGLDLGDIQTDRPVPSSSAPSFGSVAATTCPNPRVNVRVAGFTVDFLWRERRLAVETDGYGAHRGRQAFEDDRERELALGMLGIRLRRFSDRQVDGRPAEVAAAVRAALEDDPA
jgi:Protein of unknown function (DUF559)